MGPDNRPFWETKTLEEMTMDEWESLCDGCGVCCLEKLAYEDTGQVDYTPVACRHLDTVDCRCRIYARRFDTDQACTVITPETIGQIDWLPDTCAYRRVAEGRGLAWWHHLVSGDRETVHEAGVSVRNRAIPGKYVHPDDIDGYV